MKLPKLRELRELRGKTQAELAAECGRSARSIASYEAGGDARPGTARVLAEALDVSIPELVEGESPKALRSSPKAPKPQVGGEQYDTETPKRRARVEGWADYIRWRAGEIEQEIEEKIPDPDSSQTYDGEEVYRLSSAWNLERQAYVDYRDKQLQPSPGDEAMMVDGALARLGQVLKSGEARDAARSGAWDLAPDDSRVVQARGRSAWSTGG